VNEKAGHVLAEEAIHSGRAWELFRRLVSAQGGNVDYIDHIELLPSAQYQEEVIAPRSGYLSGIHARMVGETVVALGGGRSRKDDLIDYAVGVVIHYKVGAWVQEGLPLFCIHANDGAKLQEAKYRILEAHSWSESPVEPYPLFYGVIQES
jgi:pyrimidine-nucleoside phosphorylase